ncbi:hypothetical protein AYK26_03775 [Euryarchaeota archaeon SM23-78]|nr:MAG: hypothetical protein AYK26_03775 [Euryarchaeota archaeon SM23-78]MBW3000674.1 hypothetical protein [Candidatus Woesearchaeota archaeon]
MGLFGAKKKSRDEIIAEGIAQAEAEAATADQGKKDETFNSGNPKLDMEITKIHAQLESYNEIRKANSERFSRISEQMGELRGMIMDSNKTMSKIEVSATKAIDLVESVHPEKLMIEIRKQEGKAEALKANIESNEAIMRDIMDELKKMRQQMNFYKGIEQVAKLNEEVKQEILEIKKVEATIERHADKAESIFLDLEKKFAEFEKFEKIVEDLDKTFHAIQGDFDKMKLKLSNKAEKKEFGSLMDKFTEFEKHTGNILKLLDERSRHMKLELKETLKKMKEQLKRRHGIVLDEGSVRVDRLPEEEKKYLEKASGGEAKKEEATKPESKPDAKQTSKPEEKSIERKQEVKSEASGKADGVAQDKQVKKEKTGLRDVLKRRRIITKRLSDEEEAEPKEEKKDDKKEVQQKSKISEGSYGTKQEKKQEPKETKE